VVVGAKERRKKVTYVLFFLLPEVIETMDSETFNRLSEL